jgi:DNA-binding transcriptional regulator PaaX
MTHRTSPLQRKRFIRCHDEVVADVGVYPAYIFGILLDLADYRGRVVVSHEGIAVHAGGISARSVRRYLTKLKERGWVEWERYGKDTNVYFIIGDLV